MFEKSVMKLVFAACMVASAVAWAAAPSIDQVYQAAKAGDYTQAQNMMDQVLREYPNSAKAHFVEAELLARQGKLAAARNEFGTAQKLDPSRSFGKPEAIQELQSRLAGDSVQVRPADGGQAQAGSVVRQVRSITDGQIPWWPITAVVVVLALVMMLRRPRNRDAGGYNPGVPIPGNPAGPTGYPPGYGPGGATMVPPQVVGGMGPGILGGLATGAAMGAGMIAGEGLMRRVLDPGAHGQTLLPPNAPPIQSNDGSGGYDMGGSDFGVNDPGSWDSGGGGGGDWADSSGGGSNDWT